MLLFQALTSLLCKKVATGIPHSSLDGNIASQQIKQLSLLLLISWQRAKQTSCNGWHVEWGKALDCLDTGLELIFFLQSSTYVIWAWITSLSWAGLDFDYELLKNMLLLLQLVYTYCLGYKSKRTICLFVGISRIALSCLFCRQTRKEKTASKQAISNFVHRPDVGLAHSLVRSLDVFLQLWIKRMCSLLKQSETMLVPPVALIPHNLSAS